MIDWRKYLTPGWALVGILLLGGVLITVRRFFIGGLADTTNLTDQVPWGFWIGFDVISGVALASGGFTMAFLVHIVGDRTIKPIVRPAILTAFLGYMIVIVGLLFDLGKPWNIWHAIFYWNPHSVMFEVAWCVMLYTTVLFLEFLPVVFEGLRFDAALRMIKLIVIPLYILGIVLSTLHQSSLGSLFLIMPARLHPLWYTPILPVLFFLSAVTVGPAMVMVESFLSSRFLRRGLELKVLGRVGMYLAYFDLFYLVVRLQDLFKRGALGQAFTGSIEGLAFLAEMLLFIVPLGLLFSPRLRARPAPLFAAGLMVVLGLIVNRINVSLVGTMRASGGSYVPNWQEFWISAFIVVCGALAFGLIARLLPVFPKEDEEHRPIAKAAVRAGVVCALLLMGSGAGQAGEDANALRDAVDISAETRAAAQAPGEVVYETWFRGASRVAFDHSLHVEGLELACGECHHTEGCGQCHQPGRTVTLVRSDQVAVHEACFRCHEQAPRGESCGDCHESAGSETRAGVAGSPQVGREMQAWMLAAIESTGDSLSFPGERAPRPRTGGEPPTGRVFVTSLNGISIVAFDHTTHAASLDCAACHHLERCDVCHADLQHKVSVRPMQDAVMQNCVRCHESLGLPTECGRCHSDPHRR